MSEIKKTTENIICQVCDKPINNEKTLLVSGKPAHIDCYNMCNPVKPPNPKYKHSSTPTPEKEVSEWSKEYSGRTGNKSPMQEMIEMINNRHHNSLKTHFNKEEIDLWLSKEAEYLQSTLPPIEKEVENPYACFGRRPHPMDFDDKETELFRYRVLKYDEWEAAKSNTPTISEGITDEQLEILADNALTEIDYFNFPKDLFKAGYMAASQSTLPPVKEKESGEVKGYYLVKFYNHEKRYLLRFDGKVYASMTKETLPHDEIESTELIDKYL